MKIPRKIGSAYQEALLALSEQVAKIYREDVSDKVIVDAYLIQGDAFICVQVLFQESGREAWVPLEIGPEGWNEHRRQRVAREVSHVIENRLKLERLTADYVAAQTRRVIDAYR